MNQFFATFLSAGFWYGVIRCATPILFGALAALMSRRCGVTNMAIEGIMMFGALVAVIGSALSQNVWIGLLCSIVIAVVISLGLTMFKIRMQADEIMSAIAINLFATGGTVFVLYMITGEKSNSSKLANPVLPRIDIPILKDIPFIGEVFSGQNILVYVAIAAVFVIYYLLFKTPLGLRIRSVGGNPNAAESVGVSVQKMQYIAMGISGVLSGLAGAFMSLAYMNMFTAGMTAGRGYIALAASNLGGAHPIGALLASLLFGLFDFLSNSMQQMGIAPELIQMTPYLATVILYSIYSYMKMTEKRRKNKKLAKGKAA
ncbi:MAG: ABC transporter permease [Erysipelotrichaceae bacterium]|jgi:simple sugar transport system permease protein|nr:ABC transporter permease [Erysipelotrichaceae bacterium]